MYYLNITLTNYEWKPKYSQEGPGDVFFDITQELPNKLRSVFKNLSDFKAITFTTKELTFMTSDDQNKLRVHLLANFTAALNNSQEPEIFLMSKNAKGDLGKFALDRVVVKEIVFGGAVLGDWIGGNCAECCGQVFSQNRTCSGVGECHDFILKRKFPCLWKCPINCGTVRIFTFNVSLTDYEWNIDYTNKVSAEYNRLHDALTKGNDSFLFQVKTIFSKASSTAYKYTKCQVVLKKRDGYVEVSFSVVFGKPPATPDDPEAIFRFDTDSGYLGKFKIDVKSIAVSEEVLGYSFTDWKTINDGCSKCCGGEVTQTRTCIATIGKCTNAQVQRKIRCKHVCDQVQCSGSGDSVPYRLVIFISLALSLCW